MVQTAIEFMQVHQLSSRQIVLSCPIYAQRTPEKVGKLVLVITGAPCCIDTSKVVRGCGVRGPYALLQVMASCYPVWQPCNEETRADPLTAVDIHRASIGIPSPCAALPSRYQAFISGAAVLGTGKRHI